MTEASSSDDTRSESGTSLRKWVVAAMILVFFSYLLWRVVNPYRNQPYEEVPHGDHVHYVPKDRNEDVPIGRFPTRPPEEGERLTPDGEIVSDSPAG